MKKIGVVGCGTIGTQICLAIDQGKIKAELIAVADVEESKARELVKQFNHSCPILSLPDLVFQADFVVEAAGQGVVSSLIEMVLEQKKEILIMSVGGLLPIQSLKERFLDAGTNS